MGEAVEPQERARAQAQAQAQKRSSSQASTSSIRSQRGKTVRSKPLKRLSTCSSTHTATDLTSFPSLSPDRSPEGFFGEPALNHALSRALLVGNNDKEPDVERGRKATLEGLTTTLPQLSGRAALFNDSAPTQDVPGALHLASDEHIERLITRTGAVRLIRQFARDLALRDAEVSALRLRADDRERELKKMLREVEVSNHDIERRLYLLENPPDGSIDTSKTDSTELSSGQRSLTSSIDNMMNQAMLEGVGPHRDDLEATIRPHRTDSEPKSGNSSAGSSKKPMNATGRGWQDYVWGTSTASRRQSRANSVGSEAGDELRIPASTSNRRKALDGQLFQPPGASTETASLGIEGTPAYKSGDGDDRSIISQRSTYSVASWTVKLFAGKGKDSQDSNRSRASSRNPESRQSNQSTAPRASTPAGSALAALTRINGATGVQQLSARSSGASTMRSSTVNNTTKSRRLRVQSTSSAGTPGSAHPDSDATNLGPVEMDAILPMESRPPTLAYIHGEYNPGDLLTDRFGFIYDQRRNRRQREANADRPSAEHPNSTNSGSPAEIDNPDEDIGSSHGPGIWQDYLKTATRPTELLSHTPAAGPVVSVEQITQPKPRVSSVAVGKSGAVPMANNSAQPSAFTSAVVSNRAEFAGTEVRPRETFVSEQQPVKMLLQRLTELHDASQQERTVKWNEFMRKVRAERRKEGEATAALTLPDRSKPSRDMPEVALADGEVIGIAGLGNKGKIGRAKWREFRNLVLGGIPVAYRAKVWSECSGASTLRVPGYYDDLVHGHITTQTDPGATAQIAMDIHRTLTDNIFFRKGPGVARLNEVLLAYSRRNPEVGYCQGMNLIAGSLLLILPTAEDAFWVMASIIENILPPHYYDHGLVASRADQQVLCQYVSELLPNLWAHFENLGIELEALTFQWFLSIFTDCLSAEALYRVWDVVFCLNAPTTFSSTAPTSTQETAETTAAGPATSKGSSSLSTVDQDVTSTNSDGGGSTFFFQVALALLKLNEPQLLTTCSTPAAVYSYLNHQMTNHAISIDGLIQASEALRNVVKRDDVLTRRSAAIEAMATSSRPSHIPQPTPT
ncbi:small G protein signaling modulator 3 [Nannizzia gypsea CBS 118893]|uniref:Small G protein signaling modulator 3 n=1 Tax=Arthroderma gypseum (strain ATCC MYA-4604 / CBS 118893) TaxID=535722 RepID=E4UXF8_ARTGP|nr:small G protein signaling modulator 3 [Nannizzia gypsea CBS 118893]EFR01906.1 small G protein signaling modulator 3 [Nannizzia gypsea CBS 118893]